MIENILAEKESSAPPAADASVEESKEVIKTKGIDEEAKITVKETIDEEEKEENQADDEKDVRKPRYIFLLRLSRTLNKAQRFHVWKQSD